MANTVNLTRLSLTGKTVAMLVTLLLVVGLVLLILWPAVSGVGNWIGQKLRSETTDRVIASSQANATHSATEGMA